MRGPATFPLIVKPGATGYIVSDDQEPAFKLLAPVSAVEFPAMVIEITFPVWSNAFMDSNAADALVNEE
jgi:hypothetical protein